METIDLNILDLSECAGADIGIDRILQRALLNLGRCLFFLHDQILRSVCDLMEVAKLQAFLADWTCPMLSPPHPQAVLAVLVATYCQDAFYILSVNPRAVS